MESASLTAARVQARRASQAASAAENDGGRDSLASAAEQHVIAAAGFRDAAKDVGDSEALRMLKLLEAHHEQLARILKSRHTRQQSSGGAAKDQTTPSDQHEHQGSSDNAQTSHAADTDSKGGEPSSKSETIAAATPATITTTSPAVQTPASSQSLPTQRSHSPTAQRRPRREISSSIANNLATARGIRTGNTQKASPPLPATGCSPSQDLQHGSKQTSTPTTSNSSKDTQIVPGGRSAEQDTLSAGHKSADTEGKSGAGDHEASFQKFYSTFEGLISKISAPLAFAGLPLRPDENESPASSHAVSSPGPKSARGGNQHHHQQQSSLDMTKIFSNAAMRAVQEDHPGLSRPVHESFFVVPTSGGSLPYATIARQHSLKHNSANADDQQDSSQSAGPGESAPGTSGQDEFVDARESPESNRHQSQQQQRVSGKSSATTATTTLHVARGEKTPEELKLENESLRQLTDTLSRRLYMWEKSAQTQTLTLQQSIIQHQQQAAPSASSATAAAEGRSRDGDGDGAAGSAAAKARAKDEDGAKKIEELERKLAATSRDLEKQARENEKLRTVVLRYRERWEKLKEGARGRRGSTTAGGADAGPGNQAAPAPSIINP